MAEERNVDRGNSIEDVAQRLSLSKETVRRLISGGQLRAVRISARRLIVMDSEIANYVSRKTVAAA